MELESSQQSMVVHIKISHFRTVTITVEPPNNGHIGSGTTVLCWEVVLISEVPIEMYFTPQMHDSMYCLPLDIILFHCNQSHMVLNKKLRCTEIVGDGCLFGGSQLQ